MFAKPRAQRETLNDLDGRVMRFWRALRDRPDELAQAVALTPYSRTEWQQCRAEPEPADDGRYDQPDAVIYCDPPYTGSARLEPAKGYRHDDDGELWPRLIEVLADVRHAAVLLSGYPCPEADALGWPSVALRHNRTVQARSGGRLSPAPERLWLSPNAPEPVPTLLEGLA